MVGMRQLMGQYGIFTVPPHTLLGSKSSRMQMDKYMFHYFNSTYISIICPQANVSDEQISPRILKVVWTGFDPKYPLTTATLTDVW